MIKKIVTYIILMNFLMINMVSLEALAINDSNIQKSEMTRKIKKTNFQDTTYKYGYINLDWWNGYNDEFLDKYIIKAIDNNQDLKIATLKVEEARQQVKLQFSKELPNMTVGVSPMTAKLPGSSSTQGLIGIPVLAGYEADIFLKNHDKTKSAKKVFEASKLKEQAAYISVVAAVGATYFNIVKMDELIFIQEELIKERKQIYELMKKRNQQGITSTSDLVKADKAYVLATSNLIDLKRIQDILLNDLAVLIGESPNNTDDLKRITYDKLIYSPKIPKEISSEIIVNRPDYKVAEKMVEKAGIDVRIAKKEFLPDINLIGLTAFTGGSNGMSMNWTNATAAAIASVMWPVFTGGARIASLKLNKNKYEQILQDYYKTNLTAIQEVNNSLSTLKLEDEKYYKILASLEMENMDFKYTKLRYEEGIISYLDLLQRHENLLVMKKMVVDSKIDCYINQISLYKTTAAQNL